MLLTNGYRNHFGLSKLYETCVCTISEYEGL